MFHVSSTAICASGAVSDYIEESLSGRAAAARLKLSDATGVRWRISCVRRGGCAGALETATGVVAHSASIRRFLRKLHTYKKVTGRDKTAPSACEAPAAGLVPIPHSRHASTS